MKKRYPAYINSSVKAQAYARNLAREVILPRSFEIEKRCDAQPGYIDHEFLKLMCRNKAIIAFLPKKMGGLDWSYLDYVVACEEYFTADAALAGSFLFNMSWPMCALVEMRPHILMRALQELAEASKALKPLFFAWALTDANCGSDNMIKSGLITQKPNMTVEKVPGGYRLNGIKQFHCCPGNNIIISMG